MKIQYKKLLSSAKKKLKICKNNWIFNLLNPNSNKYSNNNKILPNQPQD